MILTRSDRDGVAWLRLNAPEKLNALSSEMLTALIDTLADIATDDSIRVVVLGAEGRAFSAGHDLNELRALRALAGGGSAEIAAMFDLCIRAMTAIRDLPQPVIASVQGLAAAAGCQLVAACDLAVAADSARFAVNGINIGLFCSTPMVPLSRNISRKRAFEMLATGRFLSASEAAEAGLVNRAVHADRLDEEVASLAGVIASKLPEALRLGKRAFHAQQGLTLDGAYALAAEAMVENMALDDTAEGIVAFLEKRAPDWAR